MKDATYSIAVFFTYGGILDSTYAGELMVHHASRIPPSITVLKQ